MDKNPVYSDGLADVCENGIWIMKYYFPALSPKFIKFSDIREIEKKPCTLLNGKWRFWGTGDFVTWFPLDWRRPERSLIFFLRLTTQRTIIGFTVENPGAFIDAVQSKGVKIKPP
jgi:hypothetical protein